MSANNRGRRDTHILKLLIAGNSGTGKSALLQRYVDDRFNIEYMSTIGVDFKIKNLTLEIDGKPLDVKMQCWDTAGQERFRSIAKSYYRGAQIMMFVYDITDRESFDALRNRWIPEAQEMVQDQAQVLNVLVGNKCDLTSQRVVSFSEGQQLADQYGSGMLLFSEVSARSGMNVELVFEAAAQQYYHTYPPQNNFVCDKGSTKGLPSDDDNGCLEWLRSLFGSPQKY